MSDPSSHSRTRSSGSRSTADVAEFERVDWDDVGGWRRYVSLERVVFVAGLLWVADLFYYYYSTDQVFLVWRWNLGGEDWLLLLSAVVLAAFVLVPLVRNRRRAGRSLAGLRSRPGTTLSLAYLAVVVVAGFGAQLRGLRPELTLDRFQPPVGATVRNQHTRGDCVGEVTGDNPLTQLCHWSWEYPLGTHRYGHQMTDLLALGARPTVYAVVVTLGLIVPLATVVGIVAGYHGGLVDDLLMAYVDVQLSLPAIIIYLVVYMFVLDSMFVFLAAFGLLAWGGIARIVRSETLQRREEGYVVSARAVGSSRWYVIRRHILPNVANSVLPAAFHLVAIIVLTEAGLSFLGFTPMEWSWGETIAAGLQHAEPLEVWWTSTFPAVALAVTVLACKVAGDGLRDVLDPRGERR